MGNIIVSIAVKGNIVSILIIEDGKIQIRVTDRIKDAKVLESSYSSIIYAFVIALRYVRQYIQDSKSDRDICFEVSNSIFVKWVDNQYSKDAYQTEFMEAMQLLQELPIKYAFTYSPKPKAMAYASEKYCKGMVLSSLNLED